MEDVEDETEADADAPDNHPNTVGRMEIVPTMDLNVRQKQKATSTVQPMPIWKAAAHTIVIGSDDGGQ